MESTRQTRRWLLAAGAVLLVAVTGCGSDTPPQATAVREGYPDPGQVCAGFAADRAGHDTTTDASPNDAHQRARRWLHPDLAGEQSPAGRHRQWTLWTARQVVVDVQVEPWAGDGLPIDTDQVAYRAVLVATTPVGAQGWTGATGWHTVYCTLGRAGGGWLITGYQLDGGG